MPNAAGKADISHSAETGGIILYALNSMAKSNIVMNASTETGSPWNPELSCFIFWDTRKTAPML